VLDLHQPPPPSVLLPYCPWYCNCLQCRRSTQGTRWGANAAMLLQRGARGMEWLGGGASALLPRCILGLALCALAALIRTAYVWALHCPGWSAALAAALAMALLTLRSVQRDGIVISSRLSPPSCTDTQPSLSCQWTTCNNNTVLPLQLLVSCYGRCLTLQSLPVTRLRSSLCPLPSPPWHLLPPQGQRKRKRRPLLWLHLRLHSKAHR
jgi:hypothetical protein